MTPTVSLVLPIRNEARNIEGTLESLLDQDYPAAKLEILVVDGESEDGTSEVVERFAYQHPSTNIRVIPNPHRTTPQAMNIGIAQATGEFLILVGGHSRLSGNYVRRAIE